jgi:hypothetical protein
MAGSPDERHDLEAAAKVVSRPMSLLQNVEKCSRMSNTLRFFNYLRLDLEHDPAF